MTYETILYEVEDRTATITFNRPDRLNAVNLTMETELADAYARAEADDDVWTIVVTGNRSCVLRRRRRRRRVRDDGKMPLRRPLPLALPRVGRAPGGDAAVPFDGEADHRRGQRDLLRRGPGPRHHRRHRHRVGAAPSSSIRT